MEGDQLSAEQKRKAEKHPLTVSRSAKGHGPPPKGQPAVDSRTPAEQQSGREHVTPLEPSRSPAPSSSSKAAPVGKSRFYFESDALALKNNPE